MTTEQKTEHASPESGEEHQLCVRCLAQNQTDENFCKSCGAPLSSFASTGPFESIFAEGQVYRQAAEQPRSLIVVLGIWMIFGPAALSLGLIIVWSWGSQSVFNLLLASALFLFSIVILAKTTRNYRARPMPAPEARLLADEKE